MTTEQTIPLDDLIETVDGGRERGDEVVTLAAPRLRGERMKRIVGETEFPAMLAQFLGIDAEEMLADYSMPIGVEVIGEGCEKVVIAIHIACPGAD